MCRSKLAAEKFDRENAVKQCYRSSIWDETLYKVSLIDDNGEYHTK